MKLVSLVYSLEDYSGEKKSVITYTRDVGEDQLALFQPKVPWHLSHKSVPLLIISCF